MGTSDDQHSTPTTGPSKHRGSCHCGAVRFEVTVDVSAGATRCNCSICTKVAQTGSIVKPDAFTLLAGEESLSHYEWASKTAQRCSTKGLAALARAVPQRPHAALDVRIAATRMRAGGQQLDMAATGQQGIEHTRKERRGLGHGLGRTVR